MAAPILPFPILIPRHLGTVHWTATVTCATENTFQEALDHYHVPAEERFIGLLPRDEISITFANVTVVVKRPSTLNS